MKDNLELLDTWDQSIENFKAWINFCGYKKESETYYLCEHYIQTMNDLFKWIELFDGNLDNMLETTKLYILTINIVREVC